MLCGARVGRTYKKKSRCGGAPLQIYSNTTLPVNLEILSLSPLLVFEGKHVLITSENIGMVLDIAKYGVGEEGVVFTLVTPPTYGTLALDLLTTRSDHSFTLQDINQEKVTVRPIDLPNSPINVNFVHARKFDHKQRSPRCQRPPFGHTCARP